MQQQYDIGIVGGGLAGLSLAILAADAGYNVVLFEKEEYPFHKVCGEYISFESYDFLDRLGLPLHKWNLPAIKKLLVTDIKGNEYNFQLDLGGFGISRFKIDDALYQLAIKKDAHVVTNIKVNDVLFENDAHIIQTNKQTVLAKVVAGSFGKRSNLDVKWERGFTEQKINKLNNYIGVKYHVRLTYSKDQIALHNFKNGYCGISAIEDNKYCLCYLTNAKNLSLNNNSIQQMEKNVLFQNPALKKIFTESEFLYHAPITISQISFDKKSQTENHVLMLGDAAGMITPLCGNGMSIAMHSALLAFQ
ncbi:MAG TPA: NAD(P)/FAD-dependent oxidoreductase, partial [Parafilimonas sp.]|nr:NAD(P)/FAD-dependent oxidoreductase [Parafilimonas sp.]